MQSTGSQKGKLFSSWEFLLDCLFPKQCFVCQKEGEYLCSACFDKIELTENKCYLCQAETSYLGICLGCQQQTSIDSVIVATAYSGNAVGLMVEALKYNYVEALASSLAKLIARQVEKNNLAQLLQNKLMIPVPLHRKRYLERGFNQSELLARELSVIYNNLVETEHLKRVRYTAQQAKLTRNERLANIKEAFVVDKSLYEIETVILVDDVITTGSTLACAAQELKRVGVNKIIAVAVCHG